MRKWSEEFWPLEANSLNAISAKRGKISACHWQSVNEQVILFYFIFLTEGEYSRENQREFRSPSNLRLIWPNLFSMRLSIHEFVEDISFGSSFTQNGSDERYDLESISEGNYY